MNYTNLVPAGEDPRMKPIQGIRILTTRSREQAGVLSIRLRNLGATVIDIPVISITAPDSWEPLDTAITNLDKYNWLLFASANAVKFFFNRMKIAGKTLEHMQALQVAAIGPATAASLKDEGVASVFCPSHFVAESLVSEFPGYPDLKGMHLLWPRTNVGRLYILENLQAAGARVDTIEAYKTTVPENQEQIADKLVNLLVEHKLDVITLASSYSTKNLASLISLGIKRRKLKSSIPEMLSRTLIASIGPQTTAAAKEFLGKADIEAREYTLDRLVECILKEFCKSPE